MCAFVCVLVSVSVSVFACLPACHCQVRDHGVCVRVCLPTCLPAWILGITADRVEDGESWEAIAVLPGRRKELSFAQVVASLSSGHVVVRS